MVERAQLLGEVKEGPTALLMELVFGAFNRMMRAHSERRIRLDAAERELAERACWDAIAKHAV